MYFLKKPHPFIFNAYSVIVPSAITFLIIVVLAPWQFQELGSQARILTGLFLGLFVGLSIIISVQLFKSLFRKVNIEDAWTLGKEILLIFTVVLIMIIVLATGIIVVQDQQVSIFSSVLKTASITLGLSIFPILILVLFEQYRHQQSQFKKASSLSEMLKRENNQLRSKLVENPISEKKLLLTSDRNEIELQLHPKDLMYIKSDGNYLEVFFKNENQIQKKLIRNRLKQVELELPNDLFFRCHNRFIVNGIFIIKVEGNARNLELTLKACPEKIPVSRAKTKAIGTFLNGLS